MRGKPVPIVTEYEYLGVWFTNKLLWDYHIEFARLFAVAAPHLRAVVEFRSYQRRPQHSFGLQGEISLNERSFDPASVF